ncbi:MAG: cobalamin-dependent protein [Desulfovibrionales bacterium]|nr:cobalamin-dependent protein [Desulfovibrionales bacterium]
MLGPRLVLINPWIYDFAAYDLWAKPLGLLYLAAILRRNGFRVDFVDCLYTRHSETSGGLKSGRGKRRKFGTGNFLRTPIPKPAGLKNIPRTYSRYGITPEDFNAGLKAIERPDAVLVTSLMTYWYPGVFEAIRLAKEIFPGVPIILGGIYATLCTDHARERSGADYVLSGPGEAQLLDLLSDITGHKPAFVPETNTLDGHPYPAFDLVGDRDYVCLLTSRGCPFRCAYCASHKLTPFFTQRSPEAVIGEIYYWHQNYNVRDFVFYDDALLINKKVHIWPILEGVIREKLPVRFHTPNALHIREVDDYTARLLFRAGVQTIRFGFETANMARHKDMDGKICEGDLIQAIKFLRQAGFEAKDIGVYILAGLPGQEWREVAYSIEYVKAAGGAPYLAEYSPIPGSPLWPKALETARFPIASDPVYQNNSIFPCAGDFSWETAQRIKMQARAARGISC